jgi:hypothetical protein
MSMTTRLTMRRELGRRYNPFGHMPEQGLEAIQLHDVPEPFSAWAGCESHAVKQLDS